MADTVACFRIGFDYYIRFLASRFPQTDIHFYCEEFEKIITTVENNILNKDLAFKLYDTYGFPFELTEEYLTELGYKVSKEEFDKYMEAQKQLAKKNAKNKSSMASQKKMLLDFTDKSDFAYGIYRNKSNIIAIFNEEEQIDETEEDAYVAVARTCFYAEQGGQVSDTGMIIGSNFKARVIDVFKGPNGQHIHKVRLLDGKITKGDECELVIDKEERKRTEANHSSVHILQYSLQQVISDTIHQAGSYVDSERLRFDFTYSGKITEEKLLEVEQFANNMISKNLIVSTEIMPLDKAKQLGAMALFSEKYGDTVRVVKIGKSIELCGGTHASNTKDIKTLAIYSCESKGSNVYRIEAATSDKTEKTAKQAKAEKPSKADKKANQASARQEAEPAKAKRQKQEKQPKAVEKPAANRPVVHRSQSTPAVNTRFGPGRISEGTMHSTPLERPVSLQTSLAKEEHPSPMREEPRQAMETAVSYRQYMAAQQRQRSRLATGDDRK